MDNNIKKYTREWFATNGNKKQKDALKESKNVRNLNVVKDMELDSGIFVGTREEVKARYNEIRQQRKTDSGVYLAEDYTIAYMGGVDKLFNVLDANGDNKVSIEEIQSVAALDTDEFADENDIQFSAKDLMIMYENVIGAQGAKVETNGNKATYTYKDGTQTELTFDDDGNVSSKKITTKTNEKETKTETYSYPDKTKTDEVLDSKGRAVYEKVDAPGAQKDKETRTTYDDKNKTKTVTVDTVGRTITEKYNQYGRRVSQNQTLKYDVDKNIDDTQQQSINDCWVLSGLNALRTTEMGRKLISSAITKNNDGSVTVHLKGVNKIYTYNPEQIGAHEYSKPDKTYSEGDIDMVLFEMAVGDFRRAKLNGQVTDRGESWMVAATPEDPLNFGFNEEAIRYITGKPMRDAFNPEDIDEQLTKKQGVSDKYAMVVSFKADDASISEGIITKSHTYSISTVTDDTVYVVNPWDSSKQIAYPKDKFLQNISYTTLIDLS